MAPPSSGNELDEPVTSGDAENVDDFLYGLMSENLGRPCGFFRIFGLCVSIREPTVALGS